VSAYRSIKQQQIMPHPRQQQAEQCLNRHITPEMDSTLDAAVKKSIDMVQQMQQSKLSRKMFKVNQHTQPFNGALLGKSPVGQTSRSNRQWLLVKCGTAECGR